MAQREFSSAQEGNCNYGFFANVRGPSWFWSACSPRTPGSLVSSHASQAQCLTEERALAAASTRPASQRVPVGEPHARGWQHSLPSASESSRAHSLVVFFSPLFALSMNVTAVIGRPDPEQTPRHRLGRSDWSLQNTHRWWQEKESQKPNGKEILAWK